MNKEDFDIWAAFNRVACETKILTDQAKDLNKSFEILNEYVGGLREGLLKMKLKIEVKNESEN
jgi:hypothetical protein